MEQYSPFSKLLFDGIKKLGLETGIVSFIEEGIYTVFACESKEKAIPTGTQFDLEDTYCSDVIREGKTRYYKDVAQITSMLKHPCYLNTQLRAYIGTPLRVNGKIWGTLNYSSLKPHKTEYSLDEVAFLEKQAKLMSAILEKQSVSA